MVKELSIVVDSTPPAPLPEGVRFTEPRELWAAGGRAMFREAMIPEADSTAVRIVWKKHREDFLRRGYAMRTFNSKWVIQQWLRKEGARFTLTPIGQDIVDKLDEPEELPIEDNEATVAALPPLPPDIEAKLLDYQVHPARQLFQAVTNGQEEWGYPGAWDCSDLGTGKTYQCLAAGLATGLEIAVVCPISVIGTFPSYGGKGSGWKGAFSHFGQVPRMIANYESLRTGRRDWVKLIKDGKGRRNFQWTLDPKHTLLLFDEAHNVKTAGTRNQGLALAAIRQQFPIIFISGTLASDPTHMRATGRVVGLHTGLEDYVRFLRENLCLGHPVPTKFIGGKRGLKVLVGINRKVFPRRGARVKISDLGDRFPETQILSEPYETGETAAIKAAFAEAEDLISHLEAQGRDENWIRMKRAALYTDAWHASERLKVGVMVEMVKEELEEMRSVAIFVNFTDVREALMTRLKTDCAIYGSQSPDARNRAIGGFQSGKNRIIICNIKAGGVGVSLHDEHGLHPRTAIIMPTNQADKLKQALGRVHRAGGQSRSRQIVLFAAGTIEEKICAAVRAKIANIDALNDGDLSPEAIF